MEENLTHLDTNKDMVQQVTETIENVKKRGRPKKYQSDEERLQAIRETNKRYYDSNREKKIMDRRQRYEDNREVEIMKRIEFRKIHGY